MGRGGWVAYVGGSIHGGLFHGGGEFSIEWEPGLPALFLKRSDIK